MTHEVPWTNVSKIRTMIQQNRHAYLRKVGDTYHIHAPYPFRNLSVEGLVCCNRKQELKLRKVSEKSLKAKSCKWTRHVVNRKRRKRHLGKKRKRRHRNDEFSISKNGYRFESRFGAYLMISNSGSVSVSPILNRSSVFSVYDSTQYLCSKKNTTTQGTASPNEN